MACGAGTMRPEANTSSHAPTAATQTTTQNHTKMLWSSALLLTNAAALSRTVCNLLHMCVNQFIAALTR